MQNACRDVGLDACPESVYCGNLMNNLMCDNHHAPIVLTLYHVANAQPSYRCDIVLLTCVFCPFSSIPSPTLGFLCV
jgi:hypothetical protein